jgi:DNA-binding SARP family transcriptional activator
MLRLRVLGALDATLESGEGAVRPDLGGPRQRSVLALLLVARGQVVSVDRLVEDLWSGEAPPRAIGALQAYVSHLRRALEPDRAPRTPARTSGTPSSNACASNPAPTRMSLM